MASFLTKIMRDNHKNIEKKRRHEIAVMEQMIGIYCCGQKHIREENSILCPSCQKLVDYAKARVMHCPHMAGKTFCNFCPTHCYAPKEREAIRKAMRYAGPRMIFHAPILTLRHMLLSLRERWKHK